MNFDEQETAAAAKLSAACEHLASDKGVCVFCGALQPDDPERPWEPPLRRRMHRDIEEPRPLTHTPIEGDLTSLDAANVFVFFMSQSIGMLFQVVGERQLRGEIEHCVEMARDRFGEKP